MGNFVTFYRDQSRLFGTMERLSLFLQTLFMSWRLLLEQSTKFDKDSHINLDCRRTDDSFGFFIHGHLENAIHDKVAAEIVIHVGDVPHKAGGVTTESFTRLLRNTFEIEFSLFFDGYCEWIKARNSNYHNWPPTWNFARVARNAISHGGTINIDSPNAPKVAWRSAEYDYTKEGRRLEDDIAIGDLVLLMMEMDDELNALGAPKLPYCP